MRGGGETGEPEIWIAAPAADADAATDLEERVVGDRHPRDRDGPGPGRQDAVEVQHERGLAGAVGPEQGHPLAAVHMEVHPEQRLVPTGVGVGDAPEVEDWDAHGSRTPTETTAATRAGARASAHSPPRACSGAVTGIRPVQPRLTIARCTRSPRS